mgnify:CR=1 FL=1
MNYKSVAAAREPAIYFVLLVVTSESPGSMEDFYYHHYEEVDEVARNRNMHPVLFTVGMDNLQFGFKKTELGMRSGY